MKRVSFKVAKALKKAGYSQGNTAPCYVIENCTKQYNTEIITKEIRLRIKRYKEGDYIEKLGFDDERCEPPVCYAPTYIEAWLWLWREKKIYITFCEHGGGAICSMSNGKSIFNFSNEDPEELIIEAIRYLIDNDLLK